MRATRFHRAGAIVLLAPALGAFCENADPDPAKGGYFGGVCGLRNGTYEQRVEAKRETLDGLDGIAGALKAKLGAARRANATLGTIISAERRQQHANKQSMQTLEAEIAALRSRKTLSDAQLARLNAQVDLLRKENEEALIENSNIERDAQAIENGIRDAAVARAVTKAAEHNLASSKKVTRDIDAARRSLPN